MSDFLKDFRRIGANEVCVICGRKSWCAVRRDGSAVMCSRVQSPTRCGDAGWLHRLAEIPPAERDIFIPPAPRPIELPIDLNWSEIAEDCSAALTFDDPLPSMLGLPRESLWAMLYGWNRALGCWTFPMRNGRTEIVGIRTRFLDGSKRAMTGSHNGLFIPLGATRDKSPLWICEGPTDCAALVSLGINAIGRPSNTGGRAHILEYVRRWGGTEIVIVPDRDPEGTHAAELTREATEELAVSLNNGRRVKIVRPPFAKDVRDWIRDGANREALEFAVRCQ